MSQLPYGMPTTGRYDPMSMGGYNMPIRDMRYRAPLPYPSRPPMGRAGGKGGRMPMPRNPYERRLPPLYGGGMGQVIPTNIPFRDPGYGAPMRSQNLIQSMSGPNSLVDPYRGASSLDMMDRFRQRPDYGMPRYPDFPSSGQYPSPYPTFPQPYPPMSGMPGMPGMPMPGGGGKGGRSPYPPTPGYPEPPLYTTPRFPDEQLEQPPTQEQPTQEEPTQEEPTQEGPTEEQPPVQDQPTATSPNTWGMAANPGSYTRDTWTNNGFLVKDLDGNKFRVATEEEAIRRSGSGQSPAQEQPPAEDLGYSLRPSRAGTVATMVNPFNMAPAGAEGELRNVMIDDGSGNAGRVNVNWESLTQGQRDDLTNIYKQNPDAGQRAREAYRYMRSTFGLSSPENMAQGGLASLSSGGVVPLFRGGIASLVGRN